MSIEIHVGNALEVLGRRLDKMIFLVYNKYIPSDSGEQGE